VVFNVHDLQIKLYVAIYIYISEEHSEDTKSKKLTVFSFV